MRMRFTLMGQRPQRTATRQAAMASFALLAAASALNAAITPTLAQGKDLSDKSMNTLMQYAWVLTPAKFTLPSGKEIVVDKATPDKVVVPLDTAREIVRVGRLSANAEICGLKDEEASNYQTLMAREQAKGKWSDQQVLYISQLHLLTVMMLTGRVSLVATEGEDKKVVIEDHSKDAEKPAPTCSDTERQKVAEQIRVYLAAGAPVEAKK